MKRRGLILLLGAEVVVCLLLGASGIILPSGSAELFAFPLAQIGSLLRALSLSGKAWNALALILFAGIGLLPLLLLFPVRRRRYWEDALPCLLCPALWLSLYGMINPLLLEDYFGSLSTTSMAKMAVNGGIWSILAAYAVLRILRRISSADSGQLLSMASSLLKLCLVLFIFAGACLCVQDFVGSIDSLHKGNSGNENLLGPSCFFLSLQLLIDLLPWTGDIWIGFAALSLADALRMDQSEMAVSAANQLSKRCMRVLVVVTLSVMCFNLLQLFCAPVLLVLNTQVEFPVFSMLLALAALLAARLVRENKQLRDDNELFI